MSADELVIVDALGNEHVFPAGMDPKKAAAIVQAQGTSTAAPGSPLKASIGERLLAAGSDLASGALKGAQHTVLDVGQAVHQIPGVSMFVDTLYGAPSGLSQEAFRQANEATKYENLTQRVGGALETAAEMAVPVTRVAELTPTAAKAGAKFQSVMSAAKNVPVDVSQVGDIALRTKELADRGGTMPRAISKLLNRLTDPSQAPMAYEEARDFASNISRLSADEFNRLTPVIKDQVVKLRVALNDANRRAAATVGKGELYADAMKEFAQAKRIESVWNAVKGGVMRGLPYGIAGGAAGLGYEAMKKVWDLGRGE